MFWLSQLRFGKSGFESGKLKKKKLNWSYRIQILDCYTDPLGWKDRLMGCGSITNHSWEASSMATVCKNVRNVDMLFASIVELGKGTAVVLLIAKKVTSSFFFLLSKSWFAVFYLLWFFMLAGLVGEGKNRFSLAIDSVFLHSVNDVFSTMIY